MKKIDLVCLVEDEPIQAFITTKMIKMTGMVETIMIFNNGKEAYDKLRAIILSSAKLPEIILLDLNMPIWDGWQFLDEFTKIPITTTITIYILTSSNDPADLKRAETYNLSKNYIVKPITIDDLKRILTTIE